MIADTDITNYNNTEYEDEIVSIEYSGEEDTIDINVTGNRLFYANDILTHNSAVDEIEFDHSHISGGMSKIMTADNVIGIFTSRHMREKGQYQIQLMKTRNSSGVGQKIDLSFNVDTLRISDDGDDPGYTRNSQSAGSLLDKIKTSSSVIIAETIDPETGEIMLNNESMKKVVADVQGSKLKAMLNSLKK